MKISAKLHLVFSITLFIPLILAVTFALFYYTRKIEQEARAKLEADRKVAQLILQNAINEFRNLAYGYANRKSLTVLIAYNLHQKLDAELKNIQNLDQLDFITVLSVQDGLHQPYTRQALSSSTAVSGFEMYESELSLTASTPVRNRDGVLIGAFLIRRMLKNTDMMEIIHRETHTEVFMSTQKIEQNRNYLINSLDITDLQGKPLAALVIQRSMQEYKYTQHIAILVFLFIGISGMLLVLLLRHFIIRAIVRPILTIKHTADEIRKGNYSARVNLSGDDEIGKLGTHFNAMTEQIQASLHTCNRLNEQLERTVESRTDELKRKNWKLQETLQHLKRTQAQLITQEKLASLGELTAGIAHELKNPLNFVSNFNQLIFSEVKDIEKELAKEHPNQKKLRHMFEDLPELTRRIRKNTDRAVRIIDGMLKHARGEEGMRIPTQINALVKEYVAFAYHGMRRFSMTIKEEYDPALDSSPISIVPQDISRAILNIALNACYELNRKHHTVNNEYIPILRVSTEDAGSDVIIRIRDNGDGIPEEIREKIFQPFFSTKPAGDGTGLGLSMAYDIITNIHQGSLDVTSQIGEFTEFVIHLPKEIEHR